MKKSITAVGLLVLALSLCASGCSSTDSKSTSDGNDDPSKPVALSTERVCVLSKSRAAIEICVSSKSDPEKKAIKRSIAAWFDGTDLVPEYVIERAPFRTKYKLTDINVQCLNQNMCEEPPYAPNL